MTPYPIKNLKIRPDSKTQKNITKYPKRRIIEMIWLYFLDFDIPSFDIFLSLIMAPNIKHKQLKYIPILQ